MKKTLIALAGAAAVNLLGTLVNWLSFRDHDYLLWSLKSHGGEITVEWGFALRVSHIYGMYEGQKTTHSLHFSLLSLLVCMAAAFLILLLLLTLAEKLRK